MTEVRRFAPRLVDGEPDADTAAWVRAMMTAFLGPVPGPETSARVVGAHDDQRWRGGYEAGDPTPVATLRSWDARMTVPGGEVVADAITSIGTRSTHRRQGLARTLLLDDLAEAVRRGTSIAALTSSQGSLYERFGFGLATYTRALRVDTRAAAFRDDGPTGRLRTLDPDALATVAAPLHERARRRHPGAMDRSPGSWGPLLSGFDGRDGTRQAVLWSDASGQAAGYVVHGVAEPWWNTGSARVAVHDLQATTPESYRELWRYLCGQDLVGTLSFGDASVDEPLPWLLADPRAVSSEGPREMLWLRVLDVPAALAARRYPVTERIVLRVRDPLGHAEGTWSLDTGDPLAPVVTSCSSSPDAQCDATTLGSLYLGGVDPRVLTRAGRLDEHTPGAAGRLARLFAAPSVPWNGTRF